MTAHYTVVQYVPDTTADERINIGVIAWDENRVGSDFVTDWSRARAIGGKDVSFLVDFANQVTSRTRSLDNTYGELAPAKIPDLINRWNEGIQFTQPRGSMKSIEALLLELPAMFLPAPAPPAQSHDLMATPTTPIASRAKAIQRAYSCAVLSAKARVSRSDAKQLVRKHEVLRGHYNQHLFDVVLATGSPFAAANALSFDMRDRNRLQKDIDSTAWKIDDVRKNKRMKDIPLAVYALLTPNGEGEPMYRRARKMFQGLDATVFSRDKDMIRWADSCLDIHAKTPRAVARAS
jgi:hypothetical protein